MFGTLTNSLSFLLIREWVNGGLFPLSFMLALILFVFMVNTWRIVGDGWAHAKGISTACVLFWIFSLDALRAGFVWFTYRVVNDGGVVPPWLETAVAAGFIATGVGLVVAMIACIYKFTPAKLGHSYWILSVCITIAFLLISHLAPPFPI